MGWGRGGGGVLTLRVWVETVGLGTLGLDFVDPFLPGRYVICQELVIKTLLKNGLGSQVMVFRLLYCFFLPRTSEP